MGDDGSKRGNSIRPEPTLDALERAAKDPRVAGILLHVNSPGGSALASDEIWDALRRARAKKPIVCYCSDIAASGGYYIAVGCDHIVCRPETLTGSIGVITGTFSVAGALDKLDLHVDSIYDDEVTAFNSIYAPLDDTSMARLREDARTFYRRFLDRVGMARGLPRRRLHRYARGRVYTGREAYQRGLVDQLGGFEDAVAELARRVDLDPATTDLTYVPVGKPSLRDLVTGQVSAAAHHELAALGLDDLFADAATLAVLTRRERVLALADLRPANA
jgi:protease-4